MTAVVKHQEAAALPAVQADASALMKIIERAASDTTYDVAKLQQLLSVKERWDAQEAKKAYHQAFAAFKAEAVVILKNKGVTDGPLKGKRYAELFSVVNAVTPALSRNGLSASWKLTKDEKDWIEVTCTLTHVLGHSESVSMSGPPDAGGAKNSIQARASTITYLERYTLKAACGLAEQETDTDGNPPETGMDEKLIADHLAAMEAAADVQSLQAAFSTAYKAAQAAKDKGAERSIIRAKDVRKKALEGRK